MPGVTPPHHLGNSCCGAVSYIFGYIPRVCMEQDVHSGNDKYIFSSGPSQSFMFLEDYTFTKNSSLSLGLCSRSLEPLVHSIHQLVVQLNYSCMSCFSHSTLNSSGIVIMYYLSSFYLDRFYYIVKYTYRLNIFNKPNSLTLFQRRKKWWGNDNLLFLLQACISQYFIRQGSVFLGAGMACVVRL